MNFDIRNDDTLEHPQHLEERLKRSLLTLRIQQRSADAKFLDDDVSVHMEN